MADAPPTSPTPLCPHCRYNLSGLCPPGVAGGTCPGCGRGFVLDQISNALDPECRRLANRWLLIWLVAAVVTPIVTIGLIVVLSKVGGFDPVLPWLLLLIPGVIVVFSILAARHNSVRFSPGSSAGATVALALGLSIGGLVVAGFVGFVGCTALVMTA